MSLSPGMIEISVEKARIHAFHGVASQERTVGNEFELSISVQVPISDGMRMDLIDGTVSYADLYELCVKEMAVPSDLLEHVALRIVSAVRKSFPSVHAGHLKITKLHPPIQGIDGSASVSIRF